MDVSQSRMRAEAVVPRIDVLAAGEHQPIHPVEHRAGVARIEEREDERPQTGRMERIGVRCIRSHAQHAADGLRRGGDGDGGETRHWGIGLRGREWLLYPKRWRSAAPAPYASANSCAARPSMFESFRQSLNDLMDRATPPEERRAVLTRMKQTLVQARMGLDDLRGGVAITRQRLEVEVRELETMRRRKSAATAINDAETVALAEKHEAVHAERTDVLRRKLEAQEAELVMVEREVSEMKAELKQAVMGAGSAAGTIADDARAEAEAVLDEGAGVAEEIDALSRAGKRSAREAEAEQKLAELKRRMGK